MTDIKVKNFLDFENMNDFLEKEAFDGGAFPPYLVEEIRRIYTHYEEDRDTFAKELPEFIFCSMMYKNVTIGLLSAVQNVRGEDGSLLWGLPFSCSLDLILRVLPQEPGSAQSRAALKELIDTFYIVTRESDDLTVIKETVLESVEHTRQVIKETLTTEGYRKLHSVTLRSLHNIYCYLGFVINMQYEKLPGVPWELLDNNIHHDYWNWASHGSSKGLYWYSVLD